MIWYNYYFSRIIFLFLFSLVLSWVLHALFLRFVKTLGMRNIEEIRWNSNQKPAIGGLTFYLTFLFSLSYYAYLHSSEKLFTFSTLGLIGGSTLSFLSGMYDDAFNTKPLLKAFSQILAGLIMVYTGQFFQIVSIEAVDIILTVLWVFLMMNSVNMFDNMDGITASASIATLTGMICILYLSGIWEFSFTFSTVAIISALISFLYFNKPKSKMFMGDTGTQFLGFYLAFMTVFIFNHIDNSNNVKKLYLTGLMFLPFFTDTFWVIIHRLKRNKPPYIGGKDHSSHHMIYFGFNERQVFAIISIISILSNLFAVLLYTYDFNPWIFILSIVFVLSYQVFVFYIMFLYHKRPY